MSLLYYLMASSDLWYPGRIPLCTPQVIRGLESYLEALQLAVDLRDTTFVQVAGRIGHDIHGVLYQEGLDCLGSDTDINDLLALLLQTQQAVEGCAQRDLWEDMDDIIDAIDTVRWGLILKQNGGGTDDGKQPGAVTTPDPDEGLASGTDREEDPGETGWTDGDDYHQFQAEEALPLCDDEDEGEDLATNEEESPLLGP